MTAPTLEAERAAPKLLDCPHCASRVEWCECGACGRVWCAACKVMTEFSPPDECDTLDKERAYTTSIWNRRTAAPVAEAVALPPKQSIGDDERFFDLLAEYLDADSSIGPSYDPKEAKRALIAYIDGRTAGTAPDAWVKAVHQMPPNDQAILAYGAKSLEWGVMRYSTRDGWQVETASDFHSSYPPLFWMPLPAAPSPLPPQEEANG